MKTLILILILAAALRLYGLNWDQNQHLHPDERFLTMVVQGIKWPANLPEYFDTAKSPLNPHNAGFPFYVYGTFPLFFTKLFADIFDYSDYNNFTLFGRGVSALFDIGTVFLIFLIARKITTKSGALLAAFLYAISVLPIQLSHFFAVETFLNFFIVLSFYFLTVTFHSGIKWFILLSALPFGLAIASKVTALSLIPIFLIVFVFLFKKHRWSVLFLMPAFITIAFLIFRIFQPYAFSSGSLFQINPLFIQNLKELSNMAKPESVFPPGIQWFNTTPVLFPLINFIYWGLGLPLSLAAIISFVIYLAQILQSLFKLSGNVFKLNKEHQLLLIIIIFISTTFFYQSIQFAKPLRYLLPIYPFLILLTAPIVLIFTRWLKKKVSRSFAVAAFCFLLFAFSIYPLAFITIYARPHTRVEASEWIYQNIPPGSSISYEYWDDPLPLNLPTATSSIYHGVQFSLYDPESTEKWQKMKENLQQVDYIIESSNRLYGGINQKPDKYPSTVSYYQALFDGSLGFKKVAEFTSRPTIPLPFIKLCLIPPFSNYGQIAKLVQDCPETSLSIIDDYSEESFTVYDHPKVTIFKKIKTASL